MYHSVTDHSETLFFPQPNRDLDLPARKTPFPHQKAAVQDIIKLLGQPGDDIRGLQKGRSLPQILEPLRKELNLDKILTEEAIVKAALEFYSKHGRLPSRDSTEKVPGMPAERWSAIDSAGFKGYRGLAKGRTLPKILMQLRDELAIDGDR